MIYSPRFAAAIEAVFEHVAQIDAGAAAEHASLIVDGLAILERHPRIGRPAEPPLRELVIGSGARCYVALYRYEPMAERVLVLTVRHARQAGYR